MLYGFSGVILQGAIVTLELALSSVVLAVLIGRRRGGEAFAKPGNGAYF
ncbi:histidine transporter permease [Salmonella enterica subsp. enterica serovar Typhi]|nr:histidine transporter permease [Salmonella enterica subsp. enterica serovar Typhi]